MRNRGHRKTRKRRGRKQEAKVRDGEAAKLGRLRKLGKRDGGAAGMRSYRRRGKGRVGRTKRHQVEKDVGG